MYLPTYLWGPSDLNWECWVKFRETDKGAAKELSAGKGDIETPLGHLNQNQNM